MRWADIQRVAPHSLVFDFRDVRGIAWRTKTTSKGQAFGCTAAGLLSLGSHTWLLTWLRTLDTIFEKFGNSNPAGIDFLVPRITLDNAELVLTQPLEPMRYTDALFFLRTYVGIPWRLTVGSCIEPNNYTIHGLKATLLSWSSQVSSISEEWRRQQGHHRPVNPSVRLYSRDDVFPQLCLQRTLIQEIQTGFRPQSPLHRGGQQPATELAVTVEKFKQPAADQPWAFFSFPSSTLAHPPAPPPAVQGIDSSAEESGPEEHIASSSSSSASSDSETVAERPDAAQDEKVPILDPQQQQLAVLRQTIHVVSVCTQPLAGSMDESIRMACGRMFKSSSLKMIAFDALVSEPGSLCNHPGCRHIWSNW